MSRRAIIWIAVGAGAVVGGVWMLIAGGYANGVLRQVGQRVLSRQLDAICLIHEIGGNPLRDCRVIGVQIGDWARVDTLDVAYDFWPLLTGKAVVHRLRASGVAVRIDASDEKTDDPLNSSISGHARWGAPSSLGVDISRWRLWMPMLR